MSPHRSSRFLAVGLALAAAAAPAAGDYLKIIVFDGVAAGADINGGALVETWAGGDAVKDTVHYHPTLVKQEFKRANAAAPTDTKSINGATRARIIHPVPGPVPPGGNLKVVFEDMTKELWAPGEITAKDDPPHKAGNKATADLTVASGKKGTYPVRGAGGVGNKDFANVVVGVLSGTADAGIPVDADRCHSADSWAGVYVASARTYTGGALQPLDFAGQNRFGLAGSAERNVFKDYDDPYFLTVNDLTSGESVTMEVMSLTASTVGADLFLDDAGIRMVVDLTNPQSVASFGFSSETAWVTNPYSYGATLTAGGLTVYGDAYPLAGWTVTSTADRIEAVYTFGPDGLPFDGASVLPPASLFTPGHEYSFDVGGAGGYFSVASVPEPASVILAGVGLGVLAAARRRRNA